MLPVHFPRQGLSEPSLFSQGPVSPPSGSRHPSLRILTLVHQGARIPPLPTPGRDCYHRSPLLSKTRMRKSAKAATGSSRPVAHHNRGQGRVSLRPGRRSQHRLPRAHGAPGSLPELRAGVGFSGTPHPPSVFWGPGYPPSSLRGLTFTPVRILHSPTGDLLLRLDSQSRRDRVGENPAGTLPRPGPLRALSVLTGSRQPSLRILTVVHEC